MPSPFTITKSDLLRSKVIDPGWYAVEVKKVAQEPASTDGSTNTVVEMTIIQQGAFLDCPLTKYFSEKAPGFAVPFLIACGATVGENGGNFDMDRSVGRKLLAYVKNGSYQGRTTNNVEDFKPLPDAK